MKNTAALGGLREEEKQTVASIRRGSWRVLVSRKKKTTRRCRSCSWTGSGRSLGVALLELLLVLHGVAAETAERGGGEKRRREEVARVPGGCVRADYKGRGAP
jgi:hypothetical protein